MSYHVPAKHYLLATCLLVAALLLLVTSPSARAADSIYWANENSPISHANLDGSGGADLAIPGPTTEELEGIAIDPAAGKIYWTNWNKGIIASASLAGGAATELKTAGATVNFPEGVAIDPAANKIYWANNDGGTGGQGAISYANLDGSGGAGDLNTTGATLEHPWALAIDPTSGRIYWSNEVTDGSISYANLDGSGGGDLNTSGATKEDPEGIAIDPATGKIYWANEAAKTIAYANLDGSGGGGELNTTGATMDDPNGIAIDPAAGKIYWSNYEGGPGKEGVISSANVNGSGGAKDLSTAGATNHEPALLALLKVPSATAAPLLSGSSQLGATLSCSQGGWASDAFSSLLYQAPQSFAYQWLSDGQPIAGATAASFIASQPGSYTCQVTATNAAGSASQTSAAFVISTLKLTKVKLNKRKGTATIFAQVSGPGTLTLTGKDIVKQAGSSQGAGTVKLAVKAKGKAKKLLAKKGKAKLKAEITFMPQGGTALSATKSVTLKQHLRK